LLLGARLNWILHFGRPPRYAKDVKIIQVDLCAEEMHNSVLCELAIQSHITPFAEKLVSTLSERNFRYSYNNAWWQELKDKCEKNRKTVEVVLFV